MSSKKKAEEEIPPFEVSLEKLEAIVAEMEDGKLPLDKLIVQYEAGTKLLSQCEVKLREAEQKIEILRSKSGAKAEFEAFDPTS